MPRKKEYKNKRLRAYIEGYSSLLYVKLPAYIRLWYAGKYGSPVLLRKDHAAIPIMSKSIRPTNRKAYLETSTMSQELWSVAIQNPEFNQQEWLPFVLPVSVIRNDAEVKVDGTWDMYYTDIRAFKDELALEFWRDVAEYICNMQIRNKNNGEIFRMDWTLQKFCAEHGISTEYFDQIRRAYYRMVDECVKEPSETKKAILEERDNNLRTINERVRFQMLCFLDTE